MSGCPIRGNVGWFSMMMYIYIWSAEPCCNGIRTDGLVLAVTLLRGILKVDIVAYEQYAASTPQAFLQSMKELCVS